MYVFVFFSISHEKDEDTIYEGIHLIKVSNISPKITIQTNKNKGFKTAAFDKSWTNYKRSTRALAIKCQSERIMSNGAGTLYYENNFILITTEGIAHVSIDDNLLDFSYDLEPKNFDGSPIVQAKFTELYQAEKEKAKAQSCQANER